MWVLVRQNGDPGRGEKSEIGTFALTCLTVAVRSRFQAEPLDSIVQCKYLLLRAPPVCSPLLFLKRKGGPPRAASLHCPAMPPPPLVTDEPVDRWFARPLARLVVPLLARTPITANQVTGLAGAVGVASGVALAQRQAGLFTLLTAVFVVLDCCDGQLARLKGGGGMLGRVVDGIGDYVTAISIHVGLYLWLAHDHGWGTALPWTLAAGASMSWTAFLLDQYKRRYRGDVDDLAALERELAASRGWRRLALLTLRPYARRMAREQPIADLPAYQQATRLPLRLFLLLGHTTHVTVWSALVLLGRPLLYAYAAVGPFTLLALLALVLQRRAEARWAAAG